MESFLAKHSPHIEGTLSCFDRGSFKGYLPLEWPEARESLLARRGLRIMDFKSLVTQQSARFKAWADQVREPAKRPKLAAARRKCLCFDFYDLDREFGLMHIRSPSWFPLTIPISVNGHDWLARQMTKRVKPRVKGNWVKMPCCLGTDTDKFRCLLRVETVINQPSEFKVFRQGKRNGVEGRHWLPLRKGVTNMDRSAEIGRATNGRYLKALSKTVDVAAAREPFGQLAEPARRPLPKPSSERHDNGWKSWQTICAALRRIVYEDLVS